MSRRKNNRSIPGHGNQKNYKGGFELFDVVDDGHRVPAAHLLPCDIHPDKPQCAEASAA
jgi:hypothetical protein